MNRATDLPNGELGRVLVSIPEAAAALGIGRSKLYEVIGQGDIQVVRIGRAVRVPARAVRDFAERLEREQSEAGH